jgi:hypothetical protein
MTDPAESSSSGGSLNEFTDSRNTLIEIIATAQDSGLRMEIVKNQVECSTDAIHAADVATVPVPADLRRPPGPSSRMNV